MSMLNAETPAPPDGALNPSLGQPGAFTLRDVENYLLQLLSLALFFGIGLLVTACAPFLRVLLGRERSRRAGPRLVEALFRFYGWWLERAGLFRVRFEGEQTLRSLRGAIVTPNHPGLLDAIFLIARLPRAVCIMRGGLMRNPAIFGAAWLAGYITNDHGAGMIRACQEKLRRGDNLLIFPEGTRTCRHARGVNSFKSGFALVAVLSGAPIQSVLIERSGSYLGKETGLLTAARIPIEMTIRTGEVFHARKGETAKQLARRMEDYFRARLLNTGEGVQLRS